MAKGLSHDGNFVTCTPSYVFRVAKWRLGRLSYTDWRRSQLKLETMVSVYMFQMDYVVVAVPKR